MSTLGELVEAFERFDYEVVEYDRKHITVRSVHDHQAPDITIHENPYSLSADWVQAHFVDRLTPYLARAYGG